MNSPYNGKFKVTQPYSMNHTGLDLVGIDSKIIHSTIEGEVVHAGWENPDIPTQGFGQYVCIKGNDNLYYYYGHLSHIAPTISVGANVVIGEAIGTEGDTGYSFGSHCHYEIRRTFAYATQNTTINVSLVSEIPNAVGEYDDGYRDVASSYPVTIIIGNKTYKGVLTES